MSDKEKNRNTVTSADPKKKRESLMSASSYFRGNVANKVTKSKISKNVTISSDLGVLKEEASSRGTSDIDALNHQVAYGKFLRAMLEDCLVNEKIEREKTEMDIQISQLADRFQKNIDYLDQTNRRLKDISFVVEQKRLLDLKSQDCSQFYDTTDKTNIKEVMSDLLATESSCLDKLETKNVDFGFDKNSGHKQLLDAVNDAIEGLEKIKKDSNLDTDKFNAYEKSQKSLEELDREMLDLDHFKTDFEHSFPKLSDKLFKEASQQIAHLLEDNDNEDNDVD